LRKGVRRIVAPIYDQQNHLIGCVGVAATIFSFEMDDRESLGRKAVETANQISYDMGKADLPQGVQYVDPKYQGQGIGKTPIAKAIDFSKETGYKRTCL